MVYDFAPSRSGAHARAFLGYGDEAESTNLTDGRVPIDNNWVGNHTRPIALGRKNGLFVSSVMVGQSAHKMKDIDELLPHRRASAQTQG